MRFKGVSGLLQHVEVICVRGSFFRLLWTGSVPLVDTVRASHEVFEIRSLPLIDYEQEQGDPITVESSRVVSDDEDDDDIDAAGKQRYFVLSSPK